MLYAAFYSGTFPTRATLLTHCHVHHPCPFGTAPASCGSHLHELTGVRRPSASTCTCGSNWVVPVTVETLPVVRWSLVHRAYVTVTVGNNGRANERL